MFRHKRRMELDGPSGRITGRLGYDYRLRHRRDGIAGTTILYHLRIYRRPHSPSGTTAGRRELLGMGTAAASAGAAGPSEGLRAGDRLRITWHGSPAAAIMWRSKVQKTVSVSTADAEYAEAEYYSASEMAIEVLYTTKEVKCSYYLIVFSVNAEKNLNNAGTQNVSFRWGIRDLQLGSVSEIAIITS